MKTIIYKINNQNMQQVLKHGAEIIQQGGLVVFPTETVYGIGANALNRDASKNIFKVKGRPSDNPLIVHIADVSDAKKYAKNISQDAQKLMDEFWPGPLTIVLEKQDTVPIEITGGLNTVAIRLPNNPIALGIIKEAQLPICAPSANISGTPSSTIFEHVYDDLNGKVDMIIDGGMSHVGLESTVIDLTSKQPTILRPGAITKSMIEAVLKQEVIAPTNTLQNEEIPKAPGMKYKHYAPKGKVSLLEGKHDDIVAFISTLPLENVGIIGSNELCQLLPERYTFNLGSLEDITMIAKNIFLALRTMDQKEIKEIYIESFNDEELGTAIMNRLLKAANNNVIKL